MCWKKLFLVRLEILGLFVNTLSDDDKYSRLNREKFTQKVQMQLSQTPKPFSNFSLHV